MNKCVDRIVVSNNVILAIGWCEGDSPKIAIDGKLADQQVHYRYERPDVAQNLNKSEDFAFGFRVAALAPVNGMDHSNISLVFPDNSIVNEAAINPEDRIHEIFNRFVEEVSCASPGASLIELGSRSRSGNNYRSLFSSVAKYTGVDVAPGENVEVIADIHTLSKSVSLQYDFAFSVSVFEHLLMPWVAAVELNKVLVEGGYAYIQSHPTWPLHDEPWDFFRFSKEAWKGLFNSLTGFEVLDTAYGMEASVMPVCPAASGLKDLDLQRTFLLSACLVKKISEPKVDWSCDPSAIYNLQYDY